MDSSSSPHTQNTLGEEIPSDSREMVLHETDLTSHKFHLLIHQIIWLYGMEHF